MKSYKAGNVQVYWTTLNTKTGMLESEHLSKVEMPISEAIDSIMKGPSRGIILCALIHPADAGDFGTHKDQSITYEEFFADPCKYGVMLHKGSNQTYQFE